MKKLIILGVILAAALSAGAQDCNALVLPRFGNDTARMASYPQWKLDWFCAQAQAAFYEADAVPDSAVVLPIGSVHSKIDGTSLPADFVVDLSTLSYYAYNFYEMQVSHPSANQVLCFATPSSAHPYLVLRSISQMQIMANSMMEGR